MKATMNINNPQASADHLTPELKQIGLQQLEQARCNAMSLVAGELNALLPSLEAVKDNSHLPDGLPAWLQRALTEAYVKGSGMCWKTMRKHLTQRTTDLLTATQFAEKITGESMAMFLGLDLHGIANDGWAELELLGQAMYGEVK